MNLRDCRDYLGHLQHFGIKLGLENIRILVGALGDPQTSFPSVHVAGTNGKGSVSAMLDHILRKSGFRTGLYTSPHLVRVEERIQVDGEPIPAARFCAHLARIRTLIDELQGAGRLVYHPTFFEVLTALAFLYFEECQVDVAVLEVGLGGRFDATNVVEPLVSVITTISRDHVRHLGRTLRSIAFEKAGIVKPGVPVVCGVPGGVALDEIKRRARERHSPLTGVFGPETSLDARHVSGGYRFRYRDAAGIYAFAPGLAGLYQGKNAATAIRTAEILDRTWHRIPKAAILGGIRDARWPGRLETVSRRPLVLLDGAHNEEGVTALAAHIRNVIRRKPILVFGAMKDKDLRTMTRILFPEARTIILTQVPYSRSALPEELLAAAPALAKKARLEPDVAEAVRLALAESGGRIPVVIAGSLFLIGEVKRLRLFPGD